VNFLIQINHQLLQLLNKYENTFLQFSSCHWISCTSWSGMCGSGKWSNQTRYARSKNSVRSSPHSPSQYSQEREFNMHALAFVTCIYDGIRAKNIVTEILRWTGILFRVWNSGLWWLVGLSLGKPLDAPCTVDELEPSSQSQCGRDFNLLVVHQSGSHIARGYVSKNKGMRGVKEIELAPWCAGN